MQIHIPPGTRGVAYLPGDMNSKHLDGHQSTGYHLTFKKRESEFLLNRGMKLKKLGEYDYEQKIPTKTMDGEDGEPLIRPWHVHAFTVVKE